MLVFFYYHYYSVEFYSFLRYIQYVLHFYIFAVTAVLVLYLIAIFVLIKLKYSSYYYTFFCSFSFPPGMQRRSDVPFCSHLGWDIADHIETSSRRHYWYIDGPVWDNFATSHWHLNKTDHFETP